MEDKYYTPTIEEFHVGFECYLLNSKIIIGNAHDIEICENEPILVKYLDKEDIESLGWVKTTKDFIYNDFILKILDNYQNIIIYKEMEDYPNGEYFRWEDIKFEGTVKNKSELKKLMKQLGI